MFYNIDNRLIEGKKIDINKEEDLLYWCKLFGCKRNDLVETIFKVGNSAVSVDAYLAMNCLSQVGRERR
jgi:hypothetical protein